MLRSLAFLSMIAVLATANCLAQPANASSGVSAGSKSPAPAAAEHRSEDWTKLPVERSVLKPLLNGAVLGKMDTPSYSRELVRFEWRYGDPIDMYIVKPHGVDKPRVVLYLYSFPSDIDRFMDDGWCKRATKEGLAAVGFVSALTGDRFRNRPMREWFVSELQESLGSSAHDVQLILDYLGTRDDLSAKKVGMFGQGSGGSIAILAASADPRIAALDLLNPWGDWPDWLKSSPVVPEEERARYLTPKFLQSVSMVDPVNFLPQLQDRAVRVQQIMDDPAVPPKVTGLCGWFAAQFLVARQPQPSAPTTEHK